ncbi:MAG: hypothetical protein DMF53_00395 [Acidobacteria bacterium]|nr:MAG: hypothetical protein DMF53_00395 [Acidobacteriota bacterium]
MGVIERIKNWWRRKPDPEKTSPGPVLPGPVPTLEVFSQAGHGKSSYLWSLLYMLRKMSIVWPDYLCTPQDEATKEALKGIHESVHGALLPASGPAANKHRYELHLQSMERWGDRKLIVWDWPDPVFAASLDGNRSERTNWLAPALWLVSLQDLGEVRAEILDMLFDDLMRTRILQGFAAYTRPFRLVVVLTKADAIPNLPPSLRQYLKDDPLRDAVRSEVSLLSPPLPFPSEPLRLKDESLREYLGRLALVHQEIHHWLETTLVGHMLIRRAAAYHVELRFSIVSATGSGLVDGQSLQLPWTPRRVLDPLFWALELDSVKA